MMVSLDSPDPGTKTFSELATAIKKGEVTKLEISDSVTVAEIKGTEYVRICSILC